MNRSPFRSILALVFLAVGVVGVAAEEDFLERYARTHRFRLGKPTNVMPTPDGRHVLFLRSGPRSLVRDLFELDVERGVERRVITAESLLGETEEQLTVEERARRERMRLTARGIAAYQLSQDGGSILVPLSGRVFLVDRKSGESAEVAVGSGPVEDPRLSPDGTRVAFARGGEVFVADVHDENVRRLTEGASDTVTHGLAEFVAQEEMSRYHGIWWSPDSRRLAYQRTDTAGMERLSIADATHPEQPPQSWPYPRPGMRNADVRLGLVRVEGGPTTWVEWDRERYEYLATVAWQKHGPLTLLVQNRFQTEERLLAVDVATGSATSLLVESDAAWVDIDQSVPRWLGANRGFVWTTERNGALQLELRAPDGRLRHALHGVDLGLQAFLGVLAGDEALLVRASSDPTESHLFRLPLDPSSGPPQRLTSEPGFHTAALGRNSATWVQISATLDADERWLVNGAAGPTGRELRSMAESPGIAPRLEFTTVGDDPSFHAVIVRPRDFDPSLRYPVIDHVYGGPTSQMVRKTPAKYLLDQWMADHGFIVVAVDGRGTPGRGREWQRAVKNDLIALPLADQARAVRLLGEVHREMDLSRVGIYGWSFGGYFSAMAVMREGELFRAGVAGAPVVDWRDYDTHYTERYMDLPERNADGYAASNVLTHASRLERPLLLIHGTSDDNVYFTHSLKLADALFREGKSYEFLPLAGFTHMVPDPLVTRRLYGRILGFLEANLALTAGSEPAAARSRSPRRN